MTHTLRDDLNALLRVALFEGLRPSALGFLIESGADVNAKNENGQPLLSLVVAAGEDTKRVELLLKLGADVNATDANRQTPLYTAIISNNIHAVKFLLLKGASVDVKERSHGWTPLHMAIYHGNLPIVKQLIKYGADPEATDDEGNASLHLAILHKKDDIAEYLIEEVKADVNTKGADGNSALHFCAVVKSTDTIVECLIFNGADVDAVNDAGKTPETMVDLTNGISAIREISITKQTLNRFGYDEGQINPMETNSHGETGLDIILRAKYPHLVLREFFERFPQCLQRINHVSQNGFTPIMRAKDPVTIKLLCEFGADPNLGSARYHSNHNALWMKMVSAWRPDLVNALLECGANVDYPSRRSSVTPLLYVLSVGRDNTEMAKVLLKHGANINARTGPTWDSSRSYTAVQLAALHCTAEIMVLLVKYGAKPKEEVYDNGDTPLHIACRGRFRDPDSELIKFLLSQGLDPNKRNHAGETPQSLANDEGKRAIRGWIEMDMILNREKLPKEIIRNVVRYLH